MFIAVIDQLKSFLEITISFRKLLFFAQAFRAGGKQCYLKTIPLISADPNAIRNSLIDEFKRFFVAALVHQIVLSPAI
jgi:hypothetical protein